MNSKTFIIDSGSYQVKFGYLGEVVPRFITESILGRERLPNVTGSGKNKYCGLEAKKNRHLTISYPINEGLITNSADFIDLFQCICSRLGVDARGSSIVLTEAAINQSSTKEEIAELLFEELHIENLLLPNQFELILNALDMQTGLVLQSGHGVTNTAPVFGGNVIPDAVCHVPFGGYHITASLVKKITERGFLFKSVQDFEYARLIKENYCSLSLEEQTDVASANAVINTSYISSNEQIYTIGKERFICPEELFQSVHGDYKTIQEMVTHSINQCDDNIRGGLINIILSGGTTLMSGFGERLKSELSKSFKNINIIEPPSRTNLSFIGAAKLQPPSSSNKLWMNIDNYNESGSSIIHQKRKNEFFFPC